MSSETRCISSAYGLVWDSDIALIQFAEAAGGRMPDILVRRSAALARRDCGTTVSAGVLFADGTRFPWRDQATFDMFDGQRVDYLPGAGWRGAMPHAFYATVVAHLLAWRGLIPMHACAVAVDGRAVLIAGSAGAGKSSLAAGMVAAGALMLSDDLSAVRFDPGEGRNPVVLPGRTTIRLGPIVAGWTAGTALELPATDTRGKHVLSLPMSAPAVPVPLAGVIALGHEPRALAPVDAARFLARHLFRPVWLAALPYHPERQRALLSLAAFLPVVGFPAVAGGGRVEHDLRARDVLAIARNFGPP